jgi:hypothetical protein
MIRALAFFLLIILTVFIQGCPPSSMSFISKDKMPDSITVFRPISLVYLISHSNKLDINQSLSEKSSAFVLDYLKYYLPAIYKFSIRYQDPHLSRIIAEEAISETKNIQSATDAHHKMPPDRLIQLMDSLKMDYAMFTFVSGFSRTEDNMSSEWTKSYLQELLTLGFPTWYPLKTSFYLNCFIINAKEKKYIYFKRYIDKSRDPANEFDVKFQIHNMVSGYETFKK